MWLNCKCMLNAFAWHVTSKIQYGAANRSLFTFLPSLKSSSCRFCCKISLVTFILILEVLRKSYKRKITPDEGEEGLVCRTRGCQSALHDCELDKFKRGNFYRNVAFVTVIFAENFILIFCFCNWRILGFFRSRTGYLD